MQNDTLVTAFSFYKNIKCHKDLELYVLIIYSACSSSLSQPLAYYLFVQSNDNDTRLLHFTSPS